MTDPTPKPVRSLGSGELPSRDEIMDALADQGYSVDERKAWLKTILTELAMDGDKDLDKEKLANEVKQILREQVSDKPIADDTL